MIDSKVFALTRREQEIVCLKWYIVHDAYIWSENERGMHRQIHSSWHVRAENVGKSGLSKVLSHIMLAELRTREAG